MTKAEQKKADQLEARECLAEYIKPSTVIYTRTEYGTGMTDYVEVFMAGKRNEIYKITHLVSNAIDRPMKTRRGRWQIPMGGCGYSKGLDIYLDIRYALGHQKPGSVEGQNLWREL